MAAKAPSSNGSSSNSQTQQATDVAALAAASAAAADMHSDWWRFPSQRDQQLLQLLCESVEQQVGWLAGRASLS
jgi:acyl transferase domain-containing protein